MFQNRFIFFIMGDYLHVESSSFLYIYGVSFTSLTFYSSCSLVCRHTPMVKVPVDLFSPAHLNVGLLTVYDLVSEGLYFSDF